MGLNRNGSSVVVGQCSCSYVAYSDRYAVSARQAGLPVPDDLQLRSGSFAVYIITRPRNREPSKGKRPPPSPPAAAAPGEARDAAQRQMLLGEDPPASPAFGDPAGAVVRIEEH